ncbi:MAG: hypothetical protein AAF721_23635 [Myxococcota bacterium]
MDRAALLLLAVVTVGFVVHARAWVFICDDAFISFRYADNLAEHGSLAFNVHIDPPERVEGYTNFAWVVLLAAGSAVGVPPPTLAPALTMLGAAGAVVALTWLVRIAGRRLSGAAPRGIGALDLIPAAIVVAQPELMVWAHSGLETSAAAALVIATIAAWLAGSLRAAAGLAAAAVLMRPDAALPIAVTGVAWLGVVGVPAVIHDRDALAAVPWRRVAQAAALFAVPVGAHLLWRHAYYGAWVPNTWAVKAFGRLLRDTNGAAYVQAWLDAVRPWLLLPLLPWLRSRHLILAAPALAMLAYGWSVGGDFMAYSRFFVVPTLLVAGLAGWLAADAVRWAATRRPPMRRVAEAIALALTIGWATVMAMAARDRHAEDAAEDGWLDGRWEGVHTMDRFAKAGLGAGTWMHEHLPPQTLITVGAAGAVPYASGLQVIDAFGLVDPNIATLPGLKPDTREKARPGHQIWAPVSYIKERDPDLLCHVGFRGPKRPTRRHVHRSFLRGYTWACIEPEPGRREGFYCCRRPNRRVVGPFGAPREATR